MRTSTSTSTGAVVRNMTVLAFFLLTLPIGPVSSQSKQTVNSPGIFVSIKPSVAIVIGIFSIIFSLTLLLLLYAKFCNTLSDRLSIGQNNPDAFQRDRRFSGLDKSIIASLPSFKFSSLRSSPKEGGLECAVCLSTFENSDVVRLLPKCKHMFHMVCVNQWLDNHSSCPLCRYKVEGEDLTAFNNSDFFDLFVEREVDKEDMSCYSDRRRDSPIDLEDEEGIHDRRLHRLKHQINVAGVMLNYNRWSDLNSADLTWLNSDMLNDTSNRRFSNSGNLEWNSDTVDVRYRNIVFLERQGNNSNNNNSSSSSNNNNGLKNLSNWGPTTSSDNSVKRCMSEMTEVPRFADYTGCSTSEDDKVGNLWLPIAKKTASLFGGREKLAQQQKQDHSLLEV